MWATLIQLFAWVSAEIFPEAAMPTFCLSCLGFYDDAMQMDNRPLPFYFRPFPFYSTKKMAFVTATVKNALRWKQ